MFLTLVGAAAMLAVEVPAGAVAVVSSLLLFAFVVAWCFSTTPGGTAVSPSFKAAPAAAAPVPRPATEQAPGAPRTPGAARTAARTSHVQAQHGPRRTAVRALPVPPPSPGPVRVDRTAPRGRRAAAAPVFREMPAEPSRWTRTFGPPETGQIPLQPYLAGAAASLATADADLPDRRQRSHSSL